MYKKKCGMRILNLSEVSTPDNLSKNGDEDIKSHSDGHSSLGLEEKWKNKNYETYLVRLKEAPVVKRVKNKYGDTHMTKTAMTAIAFNENKKRWQKIIDNDLYSKTAKKGNPAQ